jgi:hypothetical protein
LRLAGKGIWEMKESPLSAPPPSDVEHLYSFMRDCSKRYKEFCALSVAVEKGLFDRLDQQRSVEEVAAELGMKPVMTEDLCELLSDLGFLQRAGNGYRNTETSNAFLRRQSVWFQGEVIANLQYGFTLWERLAHVWENGPIMINDSEFFAKNNFIHSLRAQVLTGELLQTTTVISGLPEFSRATCLLDLGGGHGLYSIALCEMNPGLEAVVFDFPDMEQHATSAIIEHHATRVHFRAGNLFVDDVGGDYDIVLMSYNPGGKNPGVLGKVHRALKKGGLFITKHAFYRSDEKSKSRLLDIEWNLTGFEGTGKGRNIYRFLDDLSFEEFIEFLEEWFHVLKIVEAPLFATPALQTFGDRLDSKIVVAKKM